MKWQCLFQFINLTLDVTSLCSVWTRSSVTSSDSDMSDQVGKQQRPDSRAGHHQHRSQSSQDSTTSSRSQHERQSSASRQGADTSRQPEAWKSGYRDGSVQGMHRLAGQGTQDRGASHHHRSDSSGTGHLPHSHSANYMHNNGNSSGAESGGSTADLYGTLPRNKSRKPSSETPASAEVYQSFLNKQKCLQAEATSSQQSLESVRSDSGSDHSVSGSQQKGNKPDMRQALQDNLVQRQRQQPPSGGYPPQQYSQQQWQQEPRQQLPQRQTYGQSVQHSQSGQLARQQQQQHHHPQQQQQYPSYPQHPHSHSVAYQQQLRQLPTGGFQHPTRLPTQAPYPTQAPPTQGVPPVSGQKPTVPYPPPPAAKGRTAGGQGPVLAPCSDTTEVGRHVSSQAFARVAPSGHVPGPWQAGNGGSYLVMVNPSSLQNPPLGGQPHQGPSSVPGAGLNVPLAARPLQRCASQPDCQKLVDCAYSSNLSGT